MNLEENQLIKRLKTEIYEVIFMIAGVANVRSNDDKALRLAAAKIWPFRSG